LRKAAMAALHSADFASGGRVGRLLAASPDNVAHLRA
jgi:hypothetical protein